MKILFASMALVAALMVSPAAFAANGDYEKGVKYYFKKDYKKAVVYLEKSVARKPDPKAYYFLGYASYKLKKFDEANRYFQEAYLIDPNISPVSGH